MPSRVAVEDVFDKILRRTIGCHNRTWLRVCTGGVSYIIIQYEGTQEKGMECGEDLKVVREFESVGREMRICYDDRVGPSKGQINLF